MNEQLVLIVEETFEITDRGGVVAPMMLDLAVPGQTIEVELRRPDGTTLIDEARVEAVRISPWRHVETMSGDERRPMSSSSWSLDVFTRPQKTTKSDRSHESRVAMDTERIEQLFPEPDVLDVPHVAQLLGVGRNTIYTLVARNAIPHRRLGKAIRFSRTAVMSWLASWSLRDVMKGQ